MNEKFIRGFTKILTSCSPAKVISRALRVLRGSIPIVHTASLIAVDPNAQRQQKFAVPFAKQLHRMSATEGQQFPRFGKVRSERQHMILHIAHNPLLAATKAEKRFATQREIVRARDDVPSAAA